ncbi:MAG: hypothetical protein ACT4PU_11605 [Planctomycetota bacterium]
MVLLSLLSRVSALLLVSLFAVGCRQTALTDPEALVRHALLALQQRDEDAFLKICATREDILAAMDASATLSAEEKARTTTATADGIWILTWQEIREKQRENFWRVCDAADWANAVIQSFEVKVNDRDPHRSMDELGAWLTINGRRVGLIIDDPMLAPRGWCTAEPEPLRAHFDDRRVTVVK